jgi:hypothetical protein
MNLNYLASELVEATYPSVEIDIYTYVGQTNNLGDVTVIYSTPVTVEANVQLADRQKIQAIDGYSATTIYKAFWINNSDLTGLNRNLGSGGDYIVYNGLKYKIVGIENQFNTDWILVYGAESVISE